MIKQIAIFIIIIFAGISFFLRPNFHFLQSLDTKTNDSLIQKNMDDLSLYRTNPDEYFEILVKKQRQNTENLYLEFDAKKYRYKLYKKNLYQRLSRIYKEPNVATIEEYDFNGERLYCNLGDKYKVAKLYDYWNSDWKNYFLGNYSIPPMLFGGDEIKFIGTKKIEKFDRTCSIWHLYNKEDDDLEVCVDEDFGIFYYNKKVNTNSQEEIFDTKLTHMEIGSVTDDDFLLPENIKFIFDSALYGKIKRAYESLKKDGSRILFRRDKVQ